MYCIFHLELLCKWNSDLLEKMHCSIHDLSILSMTYLKFILPMTKITKSQPNCVQLAVEELESIGKCRQAKNETFHKNFHCIGFRQSF